MRTHEHQNIFLERLNRFHGGPSAIAIAIAIEFFVTLCSLNKDGRKCYLCHHSALRPAPVTRHSHLSALHKFAQFAFGNPGRTIQPPQTPGLNVVLPRGPSWERNPLSTRLKLSHHRPPRNMNCYLVSCVNRTLLSPTLACRRPGKQALILAVLGLGTFSVAINRGSADDWPEF